MSEGRALVEPAFRVVRYARTIGAVRRFESAPVGEALTDGDEFYRMRSAMDLSPTAGKSLSRRAVRYPRGGVPTPDQARASTFVDFGEIDACVASLDSAGVYVFKRKIPSEIVGRMLRAALTLPAVGRGLEGEPRAFPRSEPKVGRYDISEDDAMTSPDIQDYCSDPALALVAARYLRQPVIQDQTALWWTTTKGAQDAALNAWLFHQDRDRLSFLKFFCYLTDVGPLNGPHTVVRGTHQKLPRALTTDGRKDDDLVRSAGLWDQVIELTGSAGTMLAVDTAGLHKGQPPIEDDRCVLQVEFATSLFGAPVDYPLFTLSEQSRSRLAEMPAIMQRWNRAINVE